MSNIVSWGVPVLLVKPGMNPVTLPLRPGVLVDSQDRDDVPTGAEFALPVIDIATDSEWHSDGEWLSTSFAANIGGELRCFHFLTNQLPDHVHEIWRCKAEAVGDELFFLDGAEHWKPLGIVIKRIKEEFPWVSRSKKVNLLMFYSPKDLEYALGWKQVEKLYKKEKFGIDQKRNIKGSFYCEEIFVTIKDLKGWSQGSLMNFAQSLGLDSSEKGSMDDYKTRMRDGFIEHPDNSFDYSRNDVVLLHYVQAAFEKQIRAIARTTLRVPPRLWSTPKGTTGSLTADIFQEWLHAQFWTREKGWDGFNVATMKLGRLDTKSKAYEENLVKFNQDPGTLEAGDFEFLAYSQCSVGYLSRFAASGDSTAFNCLVQGGRCNNERPGEYSLDDGADIDLSSCYGTALKEFIYPIGLPTLWGYQAEQLRPTLGDFLREREVDLVPGLWTITVSGSLDFRQDLIFSKIVELSAIAQSASGGFDKETSDSDRDDDLSHIPGDFALLRKEIVNGIITDDLLKAIRAIASNQEISRLMSLRVVCAAAYLKGDRVEPSQWASIAIENDGKLENDRGNSANRSDTRTRAWCGVPIDGFVGELVKERTKLKQAAQAADGEEQNRLNAQQNGLKLLINTLYGTLASPYFPIGNTVIANNITARARLGTWMLNKALHTRQSITDGGIYTPNQVPFLTPSARNPGFNILSDNSKWRDTDKGRTFKPLADEWKESDLDAIALDQVNGFWGRYGLSLPFKIEHKKENTFLSAAYWGKADYALLRPDPYYKIRGAKNYTDGKRRSPKYEILGNILNVCDDFPDELGYDHSYLLKIGKWRLVQKSNGFEGLKAHRPGDEVIEERNARFNNTHFPCDTVKEFKRRNARKKVKDGVDVQWFEKFGAKGIKAVHREMLKDVQ